MSLVPDASYEGGETTTLGQFLAKWLALTETHMNGEDQAEFLTDLSNALGSGTDAGLFRTFLQRYGRHDQDCPAVQVNWHKGPCECGWQEVDRAYAVTGTVHPKIIRDDIPDHARRLRGEVMPITIVDGNVLRTFLRRKLIEESLEFMTLPSLEELADLAEALDAARAAHGWTPEDLEDARAKKKADKGGFDKGVVLRGGTPKEGA